MNDFIKILNKYIVLLIISSLSGMPWMYIRSIFFSTATYDGDQIFNIDYIPTLINYLIRLTTVVLLIVDFRKYQLKNTIISCIAALFFPLLGVVVFAIMFLLDEKKKTHA